MKRHPLDVFSLVTGVVVLATAVLLFQPDPELGRIVPYLPAGLVIVGVLLLLSARTGRPVADEGNTSAPAPDLVDQDIVGATAAPDDLGWPEPRWHDEPDRAEDAGGRGSHEVTRPFTAGPELSEDAEAPGSAGDVTRPFTAEPDR